ncbi:MAG: class I SAM-dependent methyltransferase [Pseudomonadota bacterium]
MMWPLWNRANEANRRVRILDDPLSAALVKQMDFRFRKKFGRPNVLHAVRARFGDDLIRQYIRHTRSDPVVVALGEGLETQLYRLSGQKINWYSVDLPVASDLRKRLLPRDSRQTLIACSALQPAWMERIPADSTPFISAAGLLMYFTETEVRRLLSKIAERFPGAELYFDSIGPDVSKKTMNGLKITRHYQAPKMPWGVAFDEVEDFVRSIPQLEPLSVVSYSDPFPERTRVYGLVSRFAILRNRWVSSLVHARATNPSPMKYGDTNAPSTQ